MRNIFVFLYIYFNNYPLSILNYQFLKVIMRYSIFSLLLFVLLGVFFSCTETSNKDKEEQNVSLMKVDWTDTTALAKAVDVFYKDSVLKKGKVALEIRDPLLKSHHPYRYLQLHKLYRQQFKPATSTVGYMPVLMLSGSDSAIVDFQITWLQKSPQDSAGYFFVTDRFLQSVGNTPFYEWEEQNGYWARKNIEATKASNKN